MRAFQRMPRHRWLGGVCSGLAYALGWPTWVVRLIWILSVLVLGFGLLLYVLLWLLVPVWSVEPSDYPLVTQDSTGSSGGN